MAERTWCPSLGQQRDSGAFHTADRLYPDDLTKPLTENKTSAKRDAAVAANSGASAQAISGDLTQSFQRRFQKFDAAVVASNANRTRWPSTLQLPNLQFSAALVPTKAAVCLDVHAIAHVPVVAPQLAIPADCVNDFISLLVRRDTAGAVAEGSDSFEGLVGLPPTSRVTSVSDIFSCLASSGSFLKRARQLTVCDASASDEPGALASFVRQAKHLESLTLANCALKDDISSALEALKDGTIQHLDLQRSGIGCSASDADRETALTSMASLLKANKFLSFLDLSYTGLDGEAVSAIVGGLVESDTRMLPQDINDEADDPFDPTSIAGRFDAAVFKGTATKSADEDLDGDDADEDDTMKDPEEESLPSSSGGDDEEDASKGGSLSGDDDGAGEDEEAERDEETEPLSAHQKNADAAKAEKKRDHERRRAELQQHKQQQRQLQELIQLEARERRSLVETYVAEARVSVTSCSANIAARYAAEKQKAKEVFCARRSGWSRLQALLLRGNRIGDAGVKQVALVLREEVPLSDDEGRERQEAADLARAAFGATLGAGRAAITTDEAKDWNVIQRAFESELATIRANDGEAAMEAGEEEEDEYAKEAPPVVLTNVEGHRGSGDENDSGHDGGGVDEAFAEETRRWEDWAANELPPVTVAAVKSGMRSITLLDLGSCHIGRKGLDALAEVLKTNTVLESLCLRHNAIAGASPKASSAAHADPVTAVSASFAHFAEMLCVNKTLRTLDLGYCQLGPDHVRALAEALRVNPALHTLGLEGNQLGVDEAYQQKRHDHSYLYDLWMAAAQPGSALQHLHLSHNSVALCLWSEEAAALAAVCGQLRSLSLCHAGLQASHLQLWAENLQQGSPAHPPTVTVLQLTRNELAGEADGKVLGTLLQCFTALEELVVDEHPLLGSAGVAAALEHLPMTMRRLSCVGTGLALPVVGAAPRPVIPSRVGEQLTSLLLGDVEAPTAAVLGEWTAHLAASTGRLQFLSLWARGMAGNEGEVLPHFVRLAKSCASLLYVDCGFKPQFRSSSPAGAYFAELERLLLPRRMAMQYT